MQSLPSHTGAVCFWWGYQQCHGIAAECFPLLTPWKQPVVWVQRCFLCTLPIVITVYIVKRFKKQYLVFSGGLCASFPLLCSIYFVFENSALLCRPTNWGLDPKLPSVLLVSSQPTHLPGVCREELGAVHVCRASQRVPVSHQLWRPRGVFPARGQW